MNVPPVYFAALAITLFIEVPVVAALYRGQRVRMALACALATTATHVIMHFLLPRVLPSGPSLIQLGELLALVAEAGVYALVSRPRDPGLALIASALANSLSFGAGLLFF